MLCGAASGRTSRFRAGRRGTLRYEPRRRRELGWRHPRHCGKLRRGCHRRHAHSPRHTAAGDPPVPAALLARARPERRRRHNNGDRDRHCAARPVRAPRGRRRHHPRLHADRDARRQRPTAAPRTRTADPPARAPATRRPAAVRRAPAGTQRPIGGRRTRAGIQRDARPARDRAPGEHAAGALRPGERAAAGRAGAARRSRPDADRDAAGVGARLTRRAAQPRPTARAAARDHTREHR